MTVASNAVYSPPGFLLYWRDGNLMAQAFDASSERTTSNPVPVAEQVDYVLANIQGQFTVSRTGVLVYNTTGLTGDSQLTWFDRDGKEQGTVGPGASPAISPDGKTVAFSRREMSTAGATGPGDIWLHDLERDTDRRLTFNSRSAGFPVWAPDGRTVAFTSDRFGVLNLFQKDTNGTGGDQALLDQSAFGRVATDWSSDGRYLIFTETDPKTSNDIWALPLGGDRKPFPILQTRFNERWGRLSPDGRWLAYASDEGSRLDVYARSFTGAPSGSGSMWQVSTNGGGAPVWRRDGRELFYVSLDRTLMSVEIIPGAAFRAGASKPLFKVRIEPNQGFGSSYDVSPDGRRFLVATQSVAADSGSITVVENWAALLKK